MSYLQQSSPPPRVITQNDVETARLESERSKARYDDAVAKLSGIVNRQRQLNRTAEVTLYISLFLKATYDEMPAACPPRLGGRPRRRCTARAG